MKSKTGLGALLAIALCACGGEDAGGSNGGKLSLSCDTINGGDAVTESRVDPGCVGCTVENAGAASDDDAYSYAAMIAPAGVPEQYTHLRSTAQPGIVYPAGSLASAFVTLPDGSSGVTLMGNQVIVLGTYLLGEQQEAFAEGLTLEADGSALQHRDLAVSAQSGLPQAYYAFRTTLPFDAVEISFNAAGLRTDMPTLKVYGLCSNGTVN